MRIDRCDGGCGKESPTPQEEHPANGWMEVFFITRGDRFLQLRVNEPNHIFCPECWVRVETAMKG